MPFLRCACFACLLLLLPFCRQRRPPVQHQVQQQPADTAAFAFHIIPAYNYTFGYEIMQHGSLCIRQQNIPCIPGKEGFRSEQEAEQVARFIIYKLRKGMIPPGITVQELDSLQVRY